MHILKSQFYEWNHLFFTEESKNRFLEANSEFYNQLASIGIPLSDLACLEVLATYRKEYYYLPLYWSDNAKVQEILLENIARNYRAVPVDKNPDLLDADAPLQTPLLPDEQPILKQYLMFFDS
ncbi:hypothetical protein [Riemerella anatipestifer]|uniref:hypothetical protein n=1 Tax=Riemerella anatipestifer TaxID=34085 RepID=UPI001E45D953|nr:hypothetical protein [Riemerella anatipestifer]MCD5969514.1 hypothetical protein [Riemerella anatipestifer]